MFRRNLKYFFVHAPKVGMKVLATEGLRPLLDKIMRFMRQTVSEGEVAAPQPPPSGLGREPAPSPEALVWMAMTGGQLNYRPAFAVHVIGDDEEAVKRTRETVESQVYPPLFTSRAGNPAATPGTWDWAVFVKPGAELKPHALYEVAMKLNLVPDLDMVYSDEERYVDGAPQAFFKPDYSPDLLCSMDYTGDMLAVRKGLLGELGNIPVDDTYDLALRVTELTSKVGHVAQVLFTGVTDANRTLWDTRLVCLKESLKRRYIEAEVTRGAFPGTFSVRRKLIGRPRVSIIIPTAARDPEKLAKCLGSIARLSSFREFEVVLIDNSGGKLPELEGLLAGTPHKIVRFDEKFNWSRVNNIGAANATGKHLLFLNDDVEVIAPDWPDWIDALVEDSQRPEVGVVGGKLLYPDDTIQHAGIFFVDNGGGARHILPRVDASSDTHFGCLSLQRNCSAVTGACLMTPKKVFDELGGFDERLALTCNDTDYCLRATGKGYLVVWTPHCLLYHHEAVSRGTGEYPEDHEIFWDRWRPFLEAGDPMYNPNLTQDGNDLSRTARPVVFEGRAQFGSDSRGIPVDTASRDRAIEAVNKLYPYKPGFLLVGIHTGLANPSRKWPEEHFARLADMFHERLGATVLFLGGPDDVGAVGRIMRMVRSKEGVYNVAGRLTADESLAAATLCGIIVGNDGGPVCAGVVDGARTLGISSWAMARGCSAPGLHATVSIGAPGGLVTPFIPLNPEKAYEASLRLLAINPRRQGAERG